MRPNPHSSQRRIVIVCDSPVSEAGQNVGGTHAVVAFLRDELIKLGFLVTIISADLYAKVPKDKSVYSYLVELLDGLEFNMIHIATQTRLGFLARRYCMLRGLKFTTAYHTQYPEFLQVRYGYPKFPFYAYERWFHSRATHVIVPTPSMARRLTERGIKNAVGCLHGVDTEMFSPGDDRLLDQYPSPRWLTVGRLVPEKNLEEILAAELPGTKFFIGEGLESYVEALQAQYPDAVFLGVQRGEQLARYYRSADVLLFASKRDTFGLVILEALACGLRVAALPETGPIDILYDRRVGCLDRDLATAARRALELDPRHCREFALEHRWPAATERFLSHQTEAYGESGDELDDQEASALEMSGLSMSGLKPLIGNLVMGQFERVVTAFQRKLFGGEKRKHKI